MSLIRLYIDEDSMHHALVAALRSRDIDVITAIEGGMIGRADEEHLEYTARHKRVLFTFNVGDFYRLHTLFLHSSRVHAGIILAQQQRYSIGEQVRRLAYLIAKKSAEDMTSCVEFLSAWDPKA